MAWTDKQKQLAVRACRAAGISEAQRVDLILRNFRHAHTGGKVTSTAPKLTNQDYAEFMSVVEKFAGGKLLHFTQGYWEKEAADSLARMRFRARGIAASLEASGKLAADGVGLAGWIRKRVTAGETDKIDDLDYHGLLALNLGLAAYAAQNAVATLAT